MITDDENSGFTRVRLQRRSWYREGTLNRGWEVDPEYTDLQKPRAADPGNK